MATPRQARQAIQNEVKKAQAKPRKGLDAKKYAGTVKWGQDPVAYQRELRGNQ